MDSEFCINCGIKFSPNAKFCGKCGGKRMKMQPKPQPKGDTDKTISNSQNVYSHTSTSVTPPPNYQGGCMCWKCNRALAFMRNEVTTVCDKCGAPNMTDVEDCEEKFTRMLKANGPNVSILGLVFGFFVFIGGLVLSWYASEIATWGNYESLMAPQYLIAGILLLIFGVVVMALSKKKYDRHKITLLYEGDYITIQEMARRIDERFERDMEKFCGSWTWDKEN